MVLRITEFLARLWVLISALISVHTAVEIITGSAIILAAALVSLQVISYIIGARRL